MVEFLHNSFESDPIRYTTYIELLDKLKNNIEIIKDAIEREDYSRACEIQNDFVCQIINFFSYSVVGEFSSFISAFPWFSDDCDSSYGDEEEINEDQEEFDVDEEEIESQVNIISETPSIYSWKLPI